MSEISFYYTQHHVSFIYLITPTDLIPCCVLSYLAQIVIVLVVTVK